MHKRVLETEDAVINPKARVKVTKMRQVVEVQYLAKKNVSMNVRKLDSNNYVDLRTGEIRQFQKTDNRSQGLNSLRKTFNKLRGYINANFEGKANELFVTLTYRGDLQTNDTGRVYEDFKKFMMRLKYKYSDTSTIDYINVLEPHASGNFHMHVLLRFNDLKSVYIANEVDRVTGESINAPLRDIWGNGNVVIKSLKGIDNIGAYLTAYLTDVELSEGDQEQQDVIEKDVQGVKKKFVKGGRLHFYPTGVNIYRKSKGIVEPEEIHMSYEEIKKEIGAATPIYRYGLELMDETTGFRNTIIKEQYNLKRENTEVLRKSDHDLPFGSLGCEGHK